MAGYIDGKFVKKSCCTTTATKMTNGGVDTQIIKEFTGHTSNAVETYKHISEEIRRSASAIIQGYKVPTATVSRPSVEKGNSKDCEIAASC